MGRGPAVHRSLACDLAAHRGPETGRVHPLLRAAAERQLGLFTAVDARRAGYDHPEIRRLCSSGAWVRLRRGVYLSAEIHAEARTQGTLHRLESLAVLLEMGRATAVLSHGSAARLWGLTVRRDLDRTVRLTDPHRWRRGSGYVMTQASLPHDDVVVRGPLRLTTLARTLMTADASGPWRTPSWRWTPPFSLVARRLISSPQQRRPRTTGRARNKPSAP